MKKIAIAVLAALSIGGSVHAAQIFSASYDMLNGDGQASGGSYNYWDKEYNGAGATTTDGAALSGGQGNLTDGVIATDYWYNVENTAGTGPYVGWYGPVPVTLNPVVTFNFSGSPVIDRVVFHIDDSHAGGVYAPAAIWIDGVNSSYTAPATASLLTVDLNGLNLTGNQHTIQFFQANAGNSWTFVSEIEFFGSNGNGVPEPATWALLLTGLGLFGAARTRRRQTLPCKSVRDRFGCA